MDVYFIVKSYTAVTAPIFSLKSIASSGGRLDLVIRASIAALSLQDPTINIKFYAILAGPPNSPITLIIDKNKLDFLSLSEKKLAIIFLKALKKKKVYGLEVKKYDLKDVVSSLKNKGIKIYYMHEDGELISKLDICKDNKIGFILGDQKGIKKFDERIIERMNIKKISLERKVSYLTSFCINSLYYYIFNCN